MERLYYWLQLNRTRMMVILATVALFTVFFVHSGTMKGVAAGVLTAAVLYLIGFGSYRFKGPGK
ncbi:hypothetical protein [Niabella beijingensis]|uniref:hypothetical protein n=1 Tax=Niabella beijingensis TaxID=2872700 RepID=UPI001CBB9E84|nr:hypothetical protein [Niabella beijingensis]MBZ4188455.1 hypothetical protein [Niabella beijingensis]